MAARRIESYELHDRTNKDGQQFTPPLPHLSISTIHPEEEKITLVRYGSTHLRVIILPDMHAVIKHV